MSVTWNNKLNTGITWIDNQHKELFRRIDTLMTAINLGRGKAEVMRLFEFLDNYIVVHFAAEEEAMSKSQFPDMTTHLAEHTKFIEDVAKLKQECSQEVSAAHVIRIKRTVIDWLFNHIGILDTKLGVYLLKTHNEGKS